MAVVIEKPPLWRRVAPVLQGYDGPFLLAVLLLAGIGLGVMYSVGHDVDGRFVAHARNMAIAAGVMFVAAQVPPPSATTLDTLVVTADVLDRDDSRPGTVSTATKTALDPKDVPQTINTLEMSKSKVYGLNDLSVLLDGTNRFQTGQFFSFSGGWST